MTKEGEYLKSQGFIPHVVDYSSKNYALIPVSGEVEYSTMRHLTCVWLKGELRAVTGLYEGNHGPSLIEPRPKRRNIIMECGGTRTPLADAHDMDRWIEKYGIEEVVRAAFAGEYMDEAT